MYEFMAKNFMKKVEKERKIERCSFLTESGRKPMTFKKVSASSAQIFPTEYVRDH